MDDQYLAYLHWLTRNTPAIINKMLRERKRRDDLWGTDFQGRPDEKWLTILGEEFGEVANAILARDDKQIEEEIIQVAAVCLSWLQHRTAMRDQARVP